MKLKLILLVGFVLFLSIGTILPFLRSGFFEFHDNTTVIRVYEMYKSLTDGMFPVRWVEDLGYGYGYPIFNFYAPLPYYIGALFSIVGFGSLLSTKIMIVIGTVLSGITMFFFSRKFFGNFGGITSAVFYMYFPYHAVNIYVRGAIGELYAYAFLPLLFLGLMSLDPKKLKDITKYNKAFFLVVFGVFLIATSHNLTIFMTLLLLIPTTLFLTITKKNRKNFLILAATSIITGMALSSFYIIPAFLEMGYTNVSSQVGGGADFRDHYVCLRQLWESQWGFGGSIPGCIDGLSFKLGKVHILVAIISLVFLAFSIKKKKFENKEKLTIVSFLLLLLSIFLTTEFSSFIWENIKYMEFIQYPWRFTNFAGLFLSFIGGYFVAKLNLNSFFKAGIVSLLITIIVFSSYKLFFPQEYNSFDDKYYENKEYINFTVSKISDEYMPKGFEKPLSLQEVPKNKIEVNSGNIVITKNETDVLIARFENVKDEIIHINTAYFPAWKSYVNGDEAPLIPVNDGMELRVPENNGELELRFMQTPIQVLGNSISLLVFILLLAVIIFSKLHGQKTS